jgi:hypothetical protein
VFAGCHSLSDLTGSQALPSGTPDPSIYHTEAGAVALYQAALATFESPQIVVQSGTPLSDRSGGYGAFVDAVLATGFFTDELSSGNSGCQASSRCTPDALDMRQFTSAANTAGSDVGEPYYSELQQVRNSASLAIGALNAYYKNAPQSWQGKLLAYQGYAEILLGDLFCSGVPLSTIDFSGDYTYHAGSTTSQVYANALARFNDALSLTIDSTQILNLVRVGRGRSLLALAQYDSAAKAVEKVPDGYSYQLLINWAPGQIGQSLISSFGMALVDREGNNGLNYLSSGDPRTAADIFGSNAYGEPIYFPVKYGGATPGIAPITVASGVEARLIEAEVALHHGDVTTYLSKLNRARQLSVPIGHPLSAVQDPGTSPGDSARITTLFQERAFDLYLTGHRQGDLRREIQQYHRQEQLIYPSGNYPLGGTYGSSISVPIPPQESVNPLFTGCLSGVE